MIDPKERCRYCFGYEERIQASHICENCQRQGPLLDCVGAAFDYQGPAATLIRQMKYADQPHLAKGAAAYMTAQFVALKWPFPDLIVPVPMAWSRHLERGFNQSELIAIELAAILGCPLEPLLQRKSGEYSQAGLTKRQRTAFEGSLITCKPHREARNKTLLLIDDVLTTGTTLRRCAEALLALQPKKIYGLVFCRAV